MNLPWRYDFENMPKDGTRFLAWVAWRRPYPAEEKFVRWRPSCKSFTLDSSSWDIEESDIEAFCLISPPITLEEGRKNA